MKDWIVGMLAVLGTLLVLAGATITVVKTLTPETATSGTQIAGVDGNGTSAGRFTRWLRRMGAADRLIGWGVVLLTIGAVAAGVIAFKIGVSAGTP
jgi:hypothetical protein